MLQFGRRNEQPTAIPIMSLDPGPLLFLSITFFLVAVFYSMAGFGGGSSYLALLSLFAYDFHFIRSHALLCNIAVVGISCFLAYRQNTFDFKKAIPFVVFSIPAAFLGALIRLSERSFFILLGIALVLAAIALFVQSLRLRSDHPRPASPFSRGNMGIGIGLLSGLTGIGGGIFLSPILNLLHWESAKNIARISSFFILVNSIASISGLAITGSLHITGFSAFALVTPVMLGGYLGSQWSIKKINNAFLKKITGFLVLIVGLRLLSLHIFNL